MSASEITILVAGVVAGEDTRNAVGWRYEGDGSLRALSYDERNLAQAGVLRKEQSAQTRVDRVGCFSKRWPSKAALCVESGAMAQIVSATVIIDPARRLAGLVSRLGACGLWRVGNRCWRRPRCRLVAGAGATRRIARAQAGSKIWPRLWREGFGL
jgi:hypothetical protein